MAEGLTRQVGAGDRGRDLQIIREFLEGGMKNVRGNAKSILCDAVIGVMLFVGFALISPRSADAQTNQGAIAGNVLDSSGAVVANVKIVATNAATGATYEAVSSSAGAYRFPNLTVGTYDLTAT